MRSAREISKGPAPDTEAGEGAARKASRVCAFILAALVAAHLVFLFRVGGESPVWSRAGESPARSTAPSPRCPNVTS